MASSLPDQIQQILTVVGNALHRVYNSHRRDTQKRLLKEENSQKAEKEKELRRAKIRAGAWHDGRLDCIAGNGVMSELGVGDELWDGDVVAVSADTDLEKQPTGNKQTQNRRNKTETNTEATNALPVVVIRNFDSKASGGMGLAASTNNREDILNVLANWAGSLVENQVAHVIVISDNRENAKKLAKGEHLNNNKSAVTDGMDSSSIKAIEFHCAIRRRSCKLVSVCEAEAQGCRFKRVIYWRRSQASATPWWSCWGFGECKCCSMHKQKSKTHNNLDDT